MKKIVVFCGSSLGFNSIYKQAASDLGKHFAKHQIELVYGGGKLGLMGILADAVLQNDGKVTGIIPELLKKEEVVHKGVKEMIISKTMSERKVLMSKAVDGYIALPGGFGTLDELFEVLTLGQLQIEQKPIGLLNVNGFFNHIIAQLDVMVEEGYLKQKSRNMLLISEAIPELMQLMNNYQLPKKSSVINKVVH